ncbi:hypothetical protein [Arenimonas sp.]|uniref:hypothetical protein n=1 Tax=Arenimonas sp. TaxID=1872635 RepID=UPI0035AF588D
MNGLLAAFGLILVGSVAAILSPLAVRWRGKAGADGLLIREEHHRKKRIGLEIGIPTRAWLDFECRVETRMDRFFKRLGWTREIQVGRNPFDKTVYLTADDPRIEALMRENEEACALLQRLVASLPPEGAGLRQIVCRDGVLRISLTTPDAADGEKIRQWALPRLRALQAALPPPGGLSVARRGRGGRRAAGAGLLAGRAQLPVPPRLAEGVAARKPGRVLQRLHGPVGPQPRDRQLSGRTPPCSALAGRVPAPLPSL